MQKKQKRSRLLLLLSAVIYAALLFFSIHFNGFEMRGFLILTGILLLCAGIWCLPQKLPIIPAILAALAAPAGMFLLSESYTHVVWETMKWDAVGLNLVFYYLLALILFFAIGRMTLALRLTLVLSALIGIANYFVILFRSGPIQPWDILSLQTAVSVANNYTYSVTWQFAWLTLGFWGVFLLCGRTGKLDLNRLKLLPNRAMNILARVVVICLLLIPGALWVRYLHDPDVSDKTSLDATLFTPNYMYKTDGFAVAFTMNLRFLQVEKPDGYSASAAEAILSEQDAEPFVPDSLPNVIVIMNECFSDPAVIGAFDTNTDYLENVSALLNGAENTISGYTHASVLGGNTADSEFEFLTGHTMGFLPIGSIPYQQYLFSDIDSVVDQFNTLGYRTVAMHPYNSGGWNRNKIYKQMHFDEMYFISQFKNAVKLRKYVDDRSDYENVLRIISETPDDPVFVFNVTMQNHSGYGTDFDNFTPEVAAQFNNTKSNKYLNNYLSLIKVADEAVGYLLSELEHASRPTIVIFFGDHQPNDYVVVPIYREHGMDINSQTLEQQQKRQMVPFFIWANYDIEEQTGIYTSINYMNSLLFEAAGLPKNAYQEFLTKLSGELPVINALGIMDREQHYFTMKEISAEWKKLLNRYEILQYYYMFDQKN